MADKKVLVVDDEIHIVHVVTIKLRNNGYDVVSASDGAEAYELACSEQPDIVVTDYHMPVMSGLELIEKLRETPQTADVPVIILTARSFAVEEQRKRQLRISKCLSKPFSPKELLRDIEDVLYQEALSRQG
jgi:CheY-like chemotaxis protein